jgi:hypothetical protein
MSPPGHPPSNVLWREGQPPEPVTPSNPLVGIELLVLKAWLESSPRLRQAYHSSPRKKHGLESAVRAVVEEQRVAELKARASGLTLEQAQELTKPAMWTPPTWPIRKTSPTPTPAAKPTAGSR